MSGMIGATQFATFQSGVVNFPYLTITRDGRLILGEGLSPEAATQAVALALHTEWQRLTGQGKGTGPMTKGQYRVGIDFNPSGDGHVDKIKRAAADLIDFIEGIPDRGEGEVKRLKAQAQTAIEDAAMWAVKAATKKSWEGQP